MVVGDQVEGQPWNQIDPEVKFKVLLRYDPRVSDFDSGVFVYESFSESH